MTNLPLLLASLRVLSDYIKDCDTKTREALSDVMDPGSRLPARAADGTKVGSVTMTEPKAAARITDEKSFAAWCAKEFPDEVTHKHVIVGSDREVIEALFEHAPHLIKRVVVPDPELGKKVLQLSAKLGAPVSPTGEFGVPGVTVSTPDPQIQCRPDETALEVVVDLFRRGELALDSLVPLQIGGE